MNAKITLLKKATLSAVIGHGVALLFLFLSSAALVKNEDPTAMMPMVALAAFFVGAAVCGIISGKNGSGAWGALASGLIFSLLLTVVSVVLDAASPISEDESGYTLGVKIALALGGALLSAVIGLWLNGRKNARSAGKRRKKTIDKYMAE